MENENTIYIVATWDYSSGQYISQAYVNEEDAKYAAEFLEITNNYVNVRQTKLNCAPLNKTHTFMINGSFDNAGNLYTFTVFDNRIDIKHEQFEFSLGVGKEKDWYGFSCLMNYNPTNENKTEFMERIKNTICDRFKEWIKEK